MNILLSIDILLNFNINTRSAIEEAVTFELNRTFADFNSLGSWTVNGRFLI